MCWKSSDVFRFDLGPLLQGQMRIAKFKSADNSLTIGPRGLQCENSLWEIIGEDSSDVFRFDLGPRLQGQTKIAKFKSTYNSRIINSLIVDPRGLQCETNLSKIMG